MPELPRSERAAQDRVTPEVTTEVTTEVTPEVRLVQEYRITEAGRRRLQAVETRANGDA